MCAEPDDLRTTLNAKLKKDELDKISLFRTEKYGTITIVRKDSKKTIMYEITPFREEGSYSDSRHPDEVQWSDNLVVDAGRRDFTINALYYSQISKPTKKSISKTEYKDEFITQTLKDNKFIVIDGFLVLQDHEIINDLLPKGNLDKNVFEKFCTDKSLESNTIIGIIRDPYLGIQDIIDGKIRAVGNPDLRFTEDALRILRAVRFQNTLNFDDLLEIDFDYEKNTWKSMKKHYFLVKNLSKERIHDEIKKVFSGPNPFAYIAILDELNLLKSLFPAIHSIKYLPQPVRYHPFDVYTHSLLALSFLQTINTNYLVRMAMLYHDCGKVEQYHSHSFNLGEEERPFIYSGWLNHVNCGQDLAEEDLTRIGFNSKEISEIKWYIKNHMKPGEILMSKPDSWKKKIRELYSEVGYEQVCNLFDITRGDRAGHYNPIQKPQIDNVNSLYDILDDLKNSEGQFTLDKMMVNGEDVMKRFELSPSPEVGFLLKKAFSWVMEDVPKRNNKEKIFKYLAKE